MSVTIYANSGTEIVFELEGNGAEGLTKENIMTALKEQNNEDVLLQAWERVKNSHQREPVKTVMDGRGPITLVLKEV